MSEKSDRDWKAELSEEQYRVLREKGTEAPFTGQYNAEKKTGTYRCAGCGTPLFHSKTKFDSGTGWPSFWAPAEGSSVVSERDDSLGRQRTEVLCAGCRGHPKVASATVTLWDGEGRSGKRNVNFRP